LQALGYCKAVFSLVEQIGDTASLAAQNAKGQQVFLLLKSQVSLVKNLLPAPITNLCICVLQGDTLSMDGKSNNQELIENVLQWLQQAFCLA